MKELSKERHPNIVLFYDCFIYKNFLWIMMEYCEEGTLENLFVLLVKLNFIIYKLFLLEQ